MTSELLQLWQKSISSFICFHFPSLLLFTFSHWTCSTLACLLPAVVHIFLYFPMSPEPHAVPLNLTLYPSTWSSPPVFYISEAGFANDCNNLCGTVSSCNNLLFISLLLYSIHICCANILWFSSHVIAVRWWGGYSLVFPSAPVAKVSVSLCRFFLLLFICCPALLYLYNPV